MTVLTFTDLALSFHGRTDLLTTDERRFIVEAAGHEFGEHARWGYALRRGGQSHWESLPDFRSYESMYDFLLGRETDKQIIVRLTGKPNEGVWSCTLYVGESTATCNGGSAAYAFIGAWLIYERNRR